MRFPSVKLRLVQGHLLKVLEARQMFEARARYHRRRDFNLLKSRESGETLSPRSLMPLERSVNSSEARQLRVALNPHR